MPWISTRNTDWTDLERDIAVFCCCDGEGGIDIKGKYLNDQAAVDAGWAIGDWYELDKGNDYGHAEGVPKRIVEPE